MQLVHVLCELQVRISHDLEMLHLQIHHYVRILRVLEALVLGLELGEGEGRLARVADLAAVPPGVRVLSEVAFSEAANFHLVDLDGAILGLEAIFDHFHVDAEDADGFILVEFGVVQTDVDTGGECLVEVSDAVSC